MTIGSFAPASRSLFYGNGFQFVNVINRVHWFASCFVAFCSDKDSNLTVKCSGDHIHVVFGIHLEFQVVFAESLANKNWPIVARVVVSSITKLYSSEINLIFLIEVYELDNNRGNCLV